MALSPDGKNIYVAGNNDNTLVVFKRDSQSGKLTFIQLLKKGADNIGSLAGATCVVVSPDSRHVYATGYNDGTLTVFNRDLDRGTLSLLEVFKYNVKGMDGLEGAIHAALSPDGHFVYVAGFRANAVTVFKRDATTGKLAFVEVQKNEIKNIDGLCGIDSLALNPNGKYLYVSSDIESALSVFSRDVNTGKLTFKKIYKNGKDGVQDLFSPRYMTISADSRHIYVSGKSNHFLLFSVRPK